MPLIEVKVIEGVFTSEQKREIGSRMTDVLVELQGEYIRPVTLCVVEEVKSGDWAVAGSQITTEDVKALAAAAA